MTTPCYYCEAPLCKVCIHGDLDIDEVPKLRAENERLKAELEEANKRIEFQKRAWAEEHKELTNLHQQLLELVCRIHRDGGHYIKEHGEAKAIADAELVVANNNAELDSLRQSQPSEDARDAVCKTCNDEGGWEAAASSTSYFWKECPDCSAAMQKGESDETRTKT